MESRHCLAAASVIFGQAGQVPSAEDSKSSHFNPHCSGFELYGLAKMLNSLLAVRFSATLILWDWRKRLQSERVKRCPSARLHFSIGLVQL